MMFVVLFTLSLLTIVAPTVPEPSNFHGTGIPDGYILQITPDCGADGSADGVIKIVTDLNADAKAVCDGDTEVDFTSTDGVNFELPFSYPDGGSETCAFIQRKDSSVFAVRIVISYGEPGSLIHQYTEEYTVTCTFGGNGDDDSAQHTVDETLIAPMELQQNVGTATSTNVELLLVDVLDDDLSSTDVNLGRIVRLKADTTSGADTCLKPVSCDAMDGSTNRYAILRAGCGDGIVFDKDEGFTTTGTSATSPYFEAFTINANSVLSFECNFTLSTTSCDGSSCEQHADGRKKRSIGRVIPISHPVFSLAHTRPVTMRGSKRTKMIGIASVERNR